jgi:hypothetical protein
MNPILNIKLIKKGGKLVPNSLLAREQYKMYLKTLKEGDEVTALFESSKNDGTKAQLAKIHICVSEMAKEQGHTVKEMKDLVKKECGFDIIKPGEYESFKGKSKEDLSQVIETIIQMGLFMGINFEQMK